jgi:hypothetical protein
MREVERQTSQTWGMGAVEQAAVDFVRVEVHAEK